MTDYMSAARIGKYRGTVMLGVEEPGSMPPAFTFGETCEVHLDESFDKLVAEIQFPGIGAHGSAVANRRATIYRWAILIVEELERRISEGDELDVLLGSLEAIVRQKSVSMGIANSV